MIKKNRALGVRVRFRCEVQKNAVAIEMIIKIPATVEPLLLTFSESLGTLQLPMSSQTKYMTSTDKMLANSLPMNINPNQNNSLKRK